MNLLWKLREARLTGCLSYELRLPETKFRVLFNDNRIYQKTLFSDTVIQFQETKGNMSKNLETLALNNQIAANQK